MRKEIISKLLSAISLLSQEELENNTNVQEQITFLFNFLGKDLPKDKFRSCIQKGLEILTLKISISKWIEYLRDIFQELALVNQRSKKPWF